jgi:hypothetical protein
MLNFIKNLFPYKTKSIEEFASFAKKESCKTVIMTPYLEAKGGANSATVGMISTFQYAVEYISTTSTGRKVILRQHLFERFGSEHGFSDSDERTKAAIKHYLFGEQKMNEMQKLLPKKMTVRLMDATDQPMDKTKFKMLHKDALKFGVSI